jgi:hypothetical protein
MRKSVCALVLLFLVQPQVTSQSSSKVEKRLTSDLRFLTSDECEGRGVGTKGLDLAAEYIERQFVNAGLKPGGPNGSFYQPFQLLTNIKRGTANQMVFQGPLGQTITLEQDKHFSVWPLSGSGKVEGAVVFAGFGITSANPKYDDYAGIDVAGKIALVLAGTPRDGNKYANLFADAAFDGSLAAKVANAVKHKAAGVIFVRREVGMSSDFAPGAEPKEEGSVALPVAMIQRRLATAMFASAGGLGLDDIERLIEADLMPRSVPLPGWTCKMETELFVTPLPVKNVIGVVEGHGPLANETVVIGAHYDHVGYFGTVANSLSKPAGYSTPGGIGGAGYPLAQLWVSAIHHGADDNASGTVAVIELARRFAAQKHRQGRRLVFIAFSAEESGLVGSFYYCRRPTFPLRGTTTMVNMDMVGRLQDDKLLVGGLGTGKSFSALIDKLNQKHHFNLTKEPAGTAPTDNTGFYLKKIPVLWFFTGFHEQYHRPTDRLETINVPGLGRVVDLIADVVKEVSILPTRPEFAKTGGIDRTKTLWSAAPAIGMVADYRPGSGGVLLDAVVPNTPAARAGLQKGDRVLAVAGKNIADPPAFLALTRSLKPAQVVDVVFDRGGKKNTLKLKLGNPAGYSDPHFGFLADLDKMKDGLLVTDVPPTSVAALAGLKKGDRVVAIAGKKITNLDAYAGVLKGLKTGQPLALTVVRDGKSQELRVSATHADPSASPAPAADLPVAPQAGNQQPTVRPATEQPTRPRFSRRRVFGRRSYCP